ncbi:hypothetical protein Tco_1317493 [Tanacetum coccineum]
MQHKHESPCASRRFHGIDEPKRAVRVGGESGGGTLGGGKVVKFNVATVKEMWKRSMIEFRRPQWRMKKRQGLEVEALVDAMEVRIAEAK